MVYIIRVSDTFPATGNICILQSICITFIITSQHLPGHSLTLIMMIVQNF